MMTSRIAFLLFLCVGWTSAAASYGELCDSLDLHSPIPDICLFTPSFQDTCTSDVGCFPQDSGLVCFGGRCQCPGGNNYFDSVKKRCFARAGTPCIPKDSVQITCDLDGPYLCSLDPKSPTGHSCSCNTTGGYVIDYERMCKGGFMSPCVNNNRDCSTFAGLQCSEGQCVCEHDTSQRWNDKVNRCVSLEGEGCGFYTDFQDEICDDDLQCVFRSPNVDKGVCRALLKEA